MRTPTRIALFALVAFAAAPAIVQAQSVAAPGDEKAAALRLPALDRTGLQPERRISTDVSEQERNPFGLVKPPVEEKAKAEEAETETEEMRIRRVLGNTRVSGISGAPGAYSVLLGGMILHEGDTLPRLFADQAETLRVQSITDREVKFVFADKDPTVVRTMGVAINLKPNVQSVLYGEVYSEIIPNKSGRLGPLAVPETSAILEHMGTNGYQSLVPRAFQLMGDAGGMHDTNSQPPVPSR